MAEKTSKRINPETQTVHVVGSVRTSKAAEPQSFNWTLDYSGVDMASLLAKASATDVITLQGRFRKNPFHQTHFDIAKDLKERPRLTTADKMRKAVAGMSDDEKAELLKQLSA